ncbi:MAG: hypothetical protein HN407_05620 [Chloroflexi bacterium]|jgi:uracil-DNA glycosylase|nr:hypothetical protein [Chloroflexota bacterium]
MKEVYIDGGGVFSYKCPQCGEWMDELGGRGVFVCSYCDIEENHTPWGKLEELKICNFCTDLCDIAFKRRYKPEEFIVGHKTSPILIVGLNPKTPKDEEEPYNDLFSSEDLEQYFDNANAVHPYYGAFKNVSEKLFGLLGKEGGVAHTDIIKCYSKEFPPKDCTNKEIEIIFDNCVPYLARQLKKQPPKIIICNGADVCRTIKKIIKPPANTGDNATSYIGNLDGEKIAVILSGFIRRIDNYARARLGKEIEHYMKKYKII